ncbi:MAG: pentapeptide repeat-containing protein [Candidatus Aminicenantes bacterium]|nr:pentapeptide repeat-containing protein [Candidatus Aminicenantes bacterium]
MEDFKVVENRKVNNLDDYINSKVIFINCKINEVQVENSYFPNLHFIGCDIYKSIFKNVVIPGLIISRDPKKIQGKARDKIIEFAKNNIINSSTIQDTEFLCCEFNDMCIDNTDFIDSKLKHCNLRNLTIMENVMLKKLDIRGSEFLEPDFGECRFHNIKFKRRWFFFDWLDALLLHLILIYFSFFSILKNRRIDIKIKTKEKMRKIGHSIKKFFYKSKVGSLIADWFSLTSFQGIQYENYKNADFSGDYQLMWYIQDFDFMNNFKNKHPFFFRLIFIISNYFNSFGALCASSFLVVYFFSCLYSAYWPNLAVDQTVNYFYLSFKIFSNFGIYYEMEGGAAPDCLTEVFIIFEIIIGYFALGTLLSIILFPFARRTSLPGSNNKKDAETPERI